MDNVITRRTIAHTFGITAGLFFALSSFGLNAWIQTQNHLYLSWLSFLLALPIFTFLTFTASIITVNAQSALKGGLVWSLAGLIIGILTVLLPFLLYPKAVFFTVPEAINWFKFDWHPDYYLIVLFSTVLCFISFLMIGLLENNFVDSTYFSNTLGILLFNALIIAIFMGVIGSVADSLVNASLRKSTSGLHYIIDYAQKHDIDSVDKDIRRNLHLGALNDIKDTLEDNHTLYVFEQNHIYETANILYKSGDLWANCYIFSHKPSNCFIISPPASK